MSDYVKSTNFASKDSLATGNPLKIVKGTEIDTEFNNIATAVATKADLNSPALLGTPTAPTASAGTSTTQLATTAFVGTAVTNERTATVTLTNKTLTSPSISSPTMTGTPVAPTASTGTNTTQVATTAFVQATIDAHTVSTAQIEDSAVTTAKIADANVTSAKLASGAATGAKLGSDVVVTSGSQTIAGIKTFSSDPVMGVSGLSGNIAAARITSALNASGSAPIYAVRTWVNFNGTGTVGIRASGNVSSITDNGTGNYTVNFTTALQDTQYAVNASSAKPSGGQWTYWAEVPTPGDILTTSVKISTGYVSGTSAGNYNAIVDSETVSVIIVR